MTHQNLSARESVDKHQKDIAAQRSAVEILTQDYTTELKEMIDLTMRNPHGHEYGISLAKLPEEDEFIQAGPTQGATPGAISMSVPNKIVDEMTDAIIPSDAYWHVSCEPRRHGYSSLIKCHTHPLADEGTVGLSAGDISDNVPGPDELLRGDNRPPSDIYRAQSAIVFANDESRLPLDNPENDWSTSHYVCDENPRERPWLHLVERTEQAQNLTSTELNNLHYETLSYGTGTPSERYQHTRDILGEAVSEIIVPLSPP